MERDYEKLGQHVIFVNAHRKPQDALINIWWIGMQGKDQKPGCNLIVVSDDPKRDDSYGRQSEHFTSVVHKDNQPAGGYYWCWPDEM